MSKTLILRIKVADDLEAAEEQLVKDSIAAEVENHDSGVVLRVEWEEDRE